MQPLAEWGSCDPSFPCTCGGRRSREARGSGVRDWPRHGRRWQGWDRPPPRTPSGGGGPSAVPSASALTGRTWGAPAGGSRSAVGWQASCSRTGAVHQQRRQNTQIASSCWFRAAESAENKQTQARERRGASWQLKRVMPRARRAKGGRRREAVGPPSAPLRGVHTAAPTPHQAHPGRLPATPGTQEPGGAEALSRVGAGYLALLCTCPWGRPTRRPHTGAGGLQATEVLEAASLTQGVSRTELLPRLQGRVLPAPLAPGAAASGAVATSSQALLLSPHGPLCLSLLRML